MKPTEPMEPNDDRIDEIIAYLLGELSEAEVSAFEQRVANDAALAAETESFRATLHLLARPVAVAPPARLRARVLSATAESARRATAHSSSPAPPARVIRRSALRFWRPAAALAAAAMLAIVVLDNARLRREMQLRDQAFGVLHQPNVVLDFAMTSAGGRANAAGTILIDLDAKKAAVAVHGLPEPPEGMTYRLWAEVDARPVYCGKLGLNATGAVLSQLPVPVESYTAPVTRLYVTLEPVDAPLQPSGPTVLESS
ncbi:MAG: anti-sigma factor domain-containing protein [bacterium]